MFNKIISQLKVTVINGGVSKMMKKGEYQRSGNQVNNFRQPGNFNNQNNQPGQVKQQMPQQTVPQGGPNPRSVKNNQEQGTRREGGYQRNFNRDNRENREVREGYQRTSYGGPRYQNRIRVDETIDDIKLDIQRIEKEIELEIKEIRSSKLGL